METDPAHVRPCGHRLRVGRGAEQGIGGGRPGAPSEDRESAAGSDAVSRPFLRHSALPVCTLREEGATQTGIHPSGPGPRLLLAWLACAGVDGVVKMATLS